MAPFNDSRILVSKGAYFHERSGPLSSLGGRGLMASGTRVLAPGLSTCGQPTSRPPGASPWATHRSRASSRPRAPGRRGAFGPRAQGDRRAGRAAGASSRMGARRAAPSSRPRAGVSPRLPTPRGSRHDGQRRPHSGLRLPRPERWSPQKQNRRDFRISRWRGQASPSVAFDAYVPPFPCAASRVAGTVGGAHVLPHVSTARDPGDDVVARQWIPRLRRFPADPTRHLLEANLFARPLVCPPPSWYCVLGTASAPAGYPADDARSEAPIHGVSPIG
jgi:hypothetical protein